MRFVILLLTFLLCPGWARSETWRVDTDTSLRRICAEKGIQVFRDENLKEPLVFLRQGDATRYFERFTRDGKNILVVQPALEQGFAAEDGNTLCYMEYAARRICTKITKANIRKGPSTGFDIADQLGSESLFRFYKIVADGFIYIRYQKNETWKEGWLSGSLVCSIPGQIENNPPVGKQPLDDSNLGDQIAGFYNQNYSQIKRQVGFTINACSAFATTALRLFGLDIPYEEWAPSLRAYLARRGWKRVTDRSQVQTGDIVFTRDDRTALDQLTNHVFIVEKVNGDGTVIALDNQGKSYIRSLYGTSKHSEMWDAYRPKK